MAFSLADITNMFNSPTSGSSAQVAAPAPTGKEYASNFVGPILPTDTRTGPVVGTYDQRTQPNITTEMQKSLQNNTNSGSGGGSNGGVPDVDMSFYGGWNDMNAIKGDWANTWQNKLNNKSGAGDPYAQLRGDINSGWDNYIRSLDDQLNGLGGQRTAQEDIANSQYRQGMNTLDLQKNQGIQTLDAERQRLETQKAKTLRDISGGIKNAFMAGNVYLGSRGAGDSSAANQYAFALTKEGSRQRGDVMQQASDNMMEIGRRQENLTNVYNTEVKNIEESKNQKISEIAQWFSNAQNQIKQAQAQGQLGKSQDLQALSRDILNQAISAMNSINTENTNRRSALEQWAISNSDNINQLKANWQNISQFKGSIPGYQTINGMPMVDSQGNFRVSTGYGTAGTNKDELLFGNK